MSTPAADATATRLWTAESAPCCRGSGLDEQSDERGAIRRNGSRTGQVSLVEYHLEGIPHDVDRDLVHLVVLGRLELELVDLKFVLDSPGVRVGPVHIGGEVPVSPVNTGPRARLDGHDGHEIERFHEREVVLVGVAGAVHA